MEYPSPIPPIPFWKKFLVGAVVSAVLTLVVNQVQQFLPFEIDSATFQLLVNSITSAIQ